MVVIANNTIEKTNNAKDEALKAADEAKKAITAGTQDLEVKNARGKYKSLNERLNDLDKDLLKSKEIGVIPVVTENNFAAIEETIDGYIEEIKLERKTLVNDATLSSLTITDTSNKIISRKGFNEGEIYTLVLDVKNSNATGNIYLGYSPAIGDVTSKLTLNNLKGRVARKFTILSDEVN